MISRNKFFGKKANKFRRSLPKKINPGHPHRLFATLNESNKNDIPIFLDVSKAENILKKIGDSPPHWYSLYKENDWLNITKISPLVLDHHPIKKLNILLRNAISENDSETVNQILSEVKSCSFKSHLLANTLHIAAKGGFNQIAQLLLEKGADIDERYGNAESTWVYQDQIENYEKRSGPTPLLTAVMFKNAELVQVLIANKADINIQANLRLPQDPEFLHYSKVAPLHFSALYGDIHTLNLLLKNGAAIDIQNAFGETPLLFAVWKGHKETVELLLKHHANQTLENNWGVPIWELTQNHEIRELLGMEHRKNTL